MTEKKTKGFIRIPIHHLGDREVSLSSIVLYHYLNFRANHKRKCWQYTKTITEETGISKAQFFRCIKELENRGWIKRENRQDKQTSNIYYVPKKSQNETTLYQNETTLSQNETTLYQNETRGGSESSEETDTSAPVFETENKNEKKNEKKKENNNMQYKICTQNPSTTQNHVACGDTSSGDSAIAPSPSDVEKLFMEKKKELQELVDNYTYEDDFNKKSIMGERIATLTVEIMEHNAEKPVTKNINIDEMKKKLEAKI